MTSRQNLGAYERVARRWDDARGGLKARRFIDELLTLCPPRPAALDLGCGTGRPIGAYLLECGCTLTGVDFSAEMLAVARIAMPQAKLVQCDIRL